MAEQNGMEKPDLQALPTINDRMTFLYLEHCKIHREDGAITARCWKSRRNWFLTPESTLMLSAKCTRCGLQMQMCQA
ncbi:hypothetical protein [Ruminococcus sp.]